MSRTSYTEITIPKAFALLHLQNIAAEFAPHTLNDKPVALSDFNVKSRDEHAITFVFIALANPDYEATYAYLIENQIPFLATYSPFNNTSAGSIYGAFDQEPVDYDLVKLNKAPVLHYGELEDHLSQCDSVETVVAVLQAIYEPPILIDWEFQDSLVSVDIMS